MTDVGDLVRFGNPTAATDAAAFATSNGTATDPTAVTLVVEKPDGTQTTYAWPTPGAGQSALTKEGTGRFYAEVTLDQDGTWRHRLVGTGAVAAAAEGTLRVTRRRVVSP